MGKTFLLTAALILAAGSAQALPTVNGWQTNALTSNGWQTNGLSSNGWQNNSVLANGALSAGAVAKNAIPFGDSQIVDVVLPR